MEKKHIGFELLIFDGLKELPYQDAALLKQAEKAKKTAYAPYSKFSVGAALLLENEEVVLGSNQENASFPAGLCAEGSALFNAGANFPNEKILAIAVIASSEVHELNRPAAPCGICRQSISEYENKQKSPIRIIMSAETGPVYVSDSISNLLPLGFDGSFL